MLRKKGVLENFAKFTEKQLRRNLFFDKIAGNFINKEAPIQIFPLNFAKYFRIPFFIEQPRRQHLNIVVF